MNKQVEVRKSTISRSKAADLISTSKGKFITITFVKANQQMRTINCKFKGKTALGNITVYGMKEKGYRSINPHNITTVKIDKTIYTVR